MNIALFLSSDGIALAHRQAAGHWAMVGETALDVPDLGAALTGLHALAVEREGEAFETLLVLPDDQILYTSLTAPTADPDLTAYRIEDGLEGLTPYAVTELEYDWRALEEDRVKIAVVARETLDEARAFAAQYGFACRGFAAMPPMERFPGVPTFDLGDEVEAMGFTAEGIAFGPDVFGMPDAEPTPEPEPEPEPLPEPEPEHAPEPAESFAAESEAEQPRQMPADVTPEPAAPAPPDDAAPQPGPEYGPEPGPGPAPEPQPEPEPETEPWDRHSALGEALQFASAATEGDAETEAPEDDDPEDDGPLHPIDDPSVSGPVASIASDREPAPGPDAGPYDAGPQDVVGVAGDDDGSLPPALSPAALTARHRARALRGEVPSAGDTPATGDTGAVSATRGPAAAPEGVDRAVGSPKAPEASAPGRAAPTPERGALVGQRSSRLGLAHPDGPARSDPAASPSAPPTTPDKADAPAASPMPRLAEQLQRVRNASKSRPPGGAAAQRQPPRPRVEITQASPLGATGASAPARPSPFDLPPGASPEVPRRPGRLAGLLSRNKAGTAKPATPDTAAPSERPAPASSPPPTGGTGASLAGLFGRRDKAPRDAPAPEVIMSTVGDETFSSGMLARKAVKPGGGSFKTGLVLTVILLLLLALVAIWSAVFLPNSTVARLLGVGSDAVAVAPAGVSSDAVAPVGSRPPPEAFSTAPVFGSTDGTAPADIATPSLADEAAADGVVLDEEGPTGTGVASAGETDAVALAAAEQEALPDIDAELDLPPLPDIDEGENPSLEEAQALYAEDGIWARSPERPALAPFDLLGEVYTASIDPEVSDFDAVALPDPGVNPGETLRRFPPPPPFGTEFTLTEDGLVAPTPEGVLTPEGAFVILATPPGFVAPPRPREVAPAAPAADSDEAVLSTFRPAERPVDLAETRERQVLGGLTEVELSERRPAARPASPQEAAAQASLFPDGDGAADPGAVDAAVAQALEGTELAVARSLMPRTRPGNIEQIVASADRTPTETPSAVAASAVAPAPSIPSNADVSRAATERNAIRLRNVNLIGVSGSASDRRALVRLASGRFVRVTVGDRLDGGRVAAIGETTLQYVRSGRTVTLEVPG